MLPHRVLVCSALLLLAAGCDKKDDPSKKEGMPVASGGPAASGAAVAPSAVAPPCKDDTNKNVGADGNVTSCVLAKDFTIDGYTCDGGKVFEMHTGGKLKSCYLNAAKVVDGTSCKDGLALYPSGKLKRCKATAPRNAGEGVEVRAGDWVTFYEAGGIKRLELEPGANKIQGLPCKGYLNFFHENGKLKKCELSEDATIEGKKVSAKAEGGAFVCFDEKGKRVADCSILTGMSLD